MSLKTAIIRCVRSPGMNSFDKNKVLLYWRLLKLKLYKFIKYTHPGFDKLSEY